VTNPPDNSPDNNPESTENLNAVPESQPATVSSGAASGPAARGATIAAWYRRLPGRPAIWLAALALVVTCIIGCCGFIAGAVASHGFGEHSISRDDRGGNDQQRGDDQRENGRDGGRDGNYGPGQERGPEHRRGKIAPTPVPSGTVTPTPTQPSTPSPAVSPTA
jgi:hypothetical protein